VPSSLCAGVSARSATNLRESDAGGSTQPDEPLVSRASVRLKSTSAIPSNFWSASPYAGNSDNAWNVNFNNGNDNNWNKSNNNRVRLVRGGE